MFIFVTQITQKIQRINLDVNRIVRRCTNIEAFFALIRGGLWEQDVRLKHYGEIDFSELMNLAEEQSVVGLVTVGLEHVIDVKVSQVVLLQFIGSTLQIEQLNKEMNSFLCKLIEKMRALGIYTLLVKGQGIAQYYEKPLWRASGDVDLFLSDENYQKAKALLLPLGEITEPEELDKHHLAIDIEGWIVELHGTLHSGLSKRIDNELDVIQREAFNANLNDNLDLNVNGRQRVWMNGKTQIFLMNETNDAIYVFTHILQHFYKGGIGLRQVCDWCRLLWTYRESLNYGLLEQRIRKAGLKSEWKAFGAFAVNWLGMPVEAMPLYNVNDSLNANLKRKAERIKDFILMSGNFGHNRDMSYYDKYPYVVRKFYSMKMRVGDLINHARIFPMDSLRFFPRIMFNGLRSAVRGE